MLHHVFGYLEHLLAGLLELGLYVKVGNWNNQVYAVGSALGHGVYVASCAAAGAANLRLEAGFSDEFDGFHFTFRNRRKPRLDNVDAEIVQPLGYAKFVFRSKTYAGGLFAIAKGGV